MQDNKEPRIRRLLLDDVKDMEYTRTLRKDFRHLLEFMLSEDKRKRLAGMHPVQRIVHQVYWLLRALIINLTPTRRLLLVLSFILYFFHFNSGNNSTNFQVFAFFILLFILMLELKDKLLAHRELEAGHGVQTALMPNESPAANGWDVWLFSRSANEVGGDIVDFLEIRTDQYYTAIGDISGKGLSAALLAIKLQATLRALAVDRESLESLGKRLNQTFCRDCLPQMFASLLYVEFAAGSDELRFLNAGHFPPVVINQSGATKFTKGGAALGLHSSMRFMEQDLTVSPGDVVLLYTDGLIEAQNEAGEFFGEERLLAFLPKLYPGDAREIGQRLVDAVDYFSGDEDRNDDLSLIVLRRKTGTV